MKYLWNFWIYVSLLYLLHTFLHISPCFLSSIPSIYIIRALLHLDFLAYALFHFLVYAHWWSILHMGSELFREHQWFSYFFELGKEFSVLLQREGACIDEILVNFSVLSKAPNFIGKIFKKHFEYFRVRNTTELNEILIHFCQVFIFITMSRGV